MPGRAGPPGLISLAAGFRGQGVCHGDRVGYLGSNHPALLVTMLAAARLGAIFAPLNFRLTGPELAFIIRDAGLHTLVADEGHQQVIDGVRDQLPVHRYVGVEGTGAGWQAFESIVNRSSRLSRPDPVAPDEVAALLYTSGTTGRPKGVLLTHANLWWNNTNLMHLFDVLADDVTLVASPLFHERGISMLNGYGLTETAVSGGDNVSSVEVENVLHSHPSVAEVAIIGLPHERWGETVVAIAVPKPGHTLMLDELREFASQSLARYKVPTQLRVVRALPRNPAGKVLKFQLREEFGPAQGGR
jgi:acyl-CoA synthetase (AMP-forming)/AMP-acid ligase II